MIRSTCHLVLGTNIHLVRRIKIIKKNKVNNKSTSLLQVGPLWDKHGISIQFFLKKKNNKQITMIKRDL